MYLMSLELSARLALRDCEIRRVAVVGQNAPAILTLSRSCCDLFLLCARMVGCLNENSKRRTYLMVVGLEAARAHGLQMPSTDSGLVHFFNVLASEHPSVSLADCIIGRMLLCMLQRTSCRYVISFLAHNTGCASPRLTYMSSA